MSKRFYCARCPMEIAEGDILCAQCWRDYVETIKVENVALKAEVVELEKEVQAWRERHG